MNAGVVRRPCKMNAKPELINIIADSVQIFDPMLTWRLKCPVHGDRFVHLHYASLYWNRAGVWEGYLLLMKCPFIIILKSWGWPNTGD